MTDIADDWFGIDPAPEPPEADYSIPAPVAKQNTSNVASGVDNTRSYATDTEASNASGGSTITSNVFAEDDYGGVGLNV